MAENHVRILFILHPQKHLKCAEVGCTQWDVSLFTVWHSFASIAMKSDAVIYLDNKLHH